MKNKVFKNNFIKFFAVILIVSAVFAFCACDKQQTNNGEKTATLIIVSSDGTVTTITDATNSNYIDEWLIELNEKNKISLTYTTGQFGMDITKLNGITVGKATSSYFAFYSNDDEFTADNEYMENYVSGELICKPCLVGQSAMPVKNNCIYVLKYTVY